MLSPTKGPAGEQVSPTEGPAGEQDKLEKDFLAREYQVEILEKAIKDNIIVFLPTGAGKTFIAVMLIKQYLKDLKKKFSEKGKRVFFLVNTTVLVKQQAQAIRNLLPLSVGEYTGDTGVDLWDTNRWMIEQDNCQVLVMTAQIYLNMIIHNFTDVEQACLLIFDECHHAVKNSPMRQIMLEIDKLGILEYPKIFGLTATLLNSNVKPNKVKDEIEALENTFHAVVVRALNNEMVMQYSANPIERLLLFDPPSEQTKVHQMLEETVAKVEMNLSQIELPELMVVVEDEPPNAVLLNDVSCKPLNKVKLGLKDALKVCEELGLYGADVSLISVLIMIECLKLSCHSSVYRILCSIDTAIHLLRKKLNVFYKESHLGAKPFVYATEKLKKLIDLLKDFPEDFRAIIFVDRRSTAHALHHIFLELKKNDESFSNINSEYIVGVNQTSQVISREAHMIRNKNKTIMKEFNHGSLNVLFASNVIEEGVDVKACNLVIKFDVPKTFRSYTQSKGRARHKQSTYIIIAPKPTLDVPNIEVAYNKFKNIEKVLKKELCNNKTLNETEPDLEDDINQEYINPYGSKVNALASISLINRYCASLPQDKFTNLTTLWWIKDEVTPEGGKQFISYLRLPMNSPLRETIEGIPRRSKISAKRMVALEACKRLYQLGEFNHHFLPLGCKSILMDDVTLFPMWDKDYLKNNCDPQMRSNKILFEKHYTKWECNSRPVPGQDVFMHVIKLSPNYPDPNTSRLQAFRNLLLHGSTFCVLSSCCWPDIPSFPLFMNVGEIKSELLSNRGFLKLSESEIDELQSFLRVLFSEAVPLLKCYNVIDPNFAIDDYLIAPVTFNNGLYEIDWDIVRGNNRFPEIKPKPFDENRLEEPVTEDRYSLKVVVPWYRPEHYNLKYVVTKVRDDLSPKSKFPSDNFKSYTDYFLNHYKQKIYNENQPMVEVRAISSKINCICPRAQYISRRQKKEEEGYEETLVPELCYLITFPSWYLIKVTLLPSAFHRIHYLLVAEELRQKIAIETGLGSLQIPAGVEWKELKVEEASTDAMEVDEVSNNLDSARPLSIPTSANNSVDIEEPLYLDPDEVEPIDIERDLSVDLVSILHYSQFVDKPLNIDYFAVKEPKSERFFQRIHKPVVPLQIIFGSCKGYGPEIVDILEALTTARSQDIINYERGELLGDSFLKFATSLALFTFYPGLNEGKLTQIKGKIIGNTNLFFCGSAKNLPGLLKFHAFDFNDWKVPGFSFPAKLKPYLDDPAYTSILLEHLADSDFKKGEISDAKIASILGKCKILSMTNPLEDLMAVVADSSSDDDASGCKKVQNISSKNEYLLKQTVPDKIVSDSVEALTSVYLRCFGIEGGFKILNWFNVLPSHICDIDRLLHSAPDSPLMNPDCDFFSLMPNLEELEDTLGYNFKDQAFVLQALSHSSYPHNMTDCYQRYEFLGDAILDFLLTAHIFEECKEMTPGQLTDLRSALVNNVTFACIAVRHRLHTHLLYKACKLTDIISKFVKFQEARKHKIGHEVLYLLEETDCQVAECIDVPKALGDLFESLIAAIYLDSGRDLNRVWTVVYNIMENEIKTFSKKIPINPIRMLHEKFSPYRPKFGKVGINNETVTVPLEVRHEGVQKIFHGMGENKYFAKLAASKAALKFFKMC